VLNPTDKNHPEDFFKTLHLHLLWNNPKIKGFLLLGVPASAEMRGKILNFVGPPTTQESNQAKSSSAGGDNFSS
jgi:hypothetical protein